MKIILQQEVKGLGHKGDTVIVADGRAMNFLVPQGIATLATEKTVKWSQGQKAKRIAQKEEVIKKARTYADLLNQTILIFKRKTTKKDSEKLFGAITEKDILKKIREEVKIDLEKKQIKMESHFKKIGEFKIEIHLTEDINALVTVKVEAENKKSEANEGSKKKIIKEFS